MSGEKRPISESSLNVEEQAKNHSEAAAPKPEKRAEQAEAPTEPVSLGELAGEDSLTTSPADAKAPLPEDLAKENKSADHKGQINAIEAKALFQDRRTDAAEESSVVLRDPLTVLARVRELAHCIVHFLDPRDTANNATLVSKTW